MRKCRAVLKLIRKLSLSLRVDRHTKDLYANFPLYVSKSVASPPSVRSRHNAHT